MILQEVYHLSRFMGKVSTSNAAFVSLRFILCISHVFLFENSLATDTLAQSQELSVGQTLISSDQMFELGFFSPSNSSKRYIGIWYKKITWHKPVWVANRENPLDISDIGSVLTVGFDGNLKLLDGKRNTVWSTKVSSNPNSTFALLSTSGDFSLRDNSSGNPLWESFSYPSDSLIAYMKIGFNHKTGEKYELNSWLGEDDPSPGDFVKGYTNETPPQNIIWKNSKTHWRSGPWDGDKFIGLQQKQAGYAHGFTITQDHEEGSVIGTYTSPSMSKVKIDFV